MAEAGTLSPGTSGQEVDILIVTPLEEERDAILDKLPGYQKVDPSEDDIYVYFRADVPATFPSGLIGTYQIAVMPLLDMGRVQAANATNDGIRRWNPRYVVLVGIAGGVEANKVGLGDILVSDSIVDYELQKLTAEGPDIRWKTYNVSSRLLGAARNFIGESWPSLIKVERPEPGQPKRHIGPIASGDKVVDFAEALEKYRETWSKLIGVEMEAGGVALSVLQAEKRARFFMIRGVSDLADGDKSAPQVKKWRPYACDAAATYTIALLKSGPVPLFSVRSRSEDRSIHRSGSVDEQILLVIYTYFEKYPGKSNMSFTELVKHVGAEKKKLIAALRGLSEKGWLDFALVSSGRAGTVWLTEEGISTAESLLNG